MTSGDRPPGNPAAHGVSAAHTNLGYGGGCGFHRQYMGHAAMMSLDLVSVFLYDMFFTAFSHAAGLLWAFAFAMGVFWAFRRVFVEKS